MNETYSDSDFRSMIQHEAEQTHRRLSWLGTFQGFLFAALGFSWGKNAALTTIICCLGLAVAILIYLGVLSSVLATKRVRADWLLHRPPDYKGPDIFGFYPHRAPFSLFISPEMLIPLAFAVAWACVLANK